MLGFIQAVFDNPSPHTIRLLAFGAYVLFSAAALVVIVVAAISIRRRRKQFRNFR